ncbi:MAG: stage II sporulation protein M, partial [Leptonema sp. (in: Bacteria)]|nr:stage II sporulation protein M [Leptonema sp. (in: bacteria)]
SIFFTLYNAISLGATIGFLLNSPAAEGIQSWIFGHAPFELTAIGFAAGAGLQTGLALLRPGNRSRIGAVQVEGRRALPALLTALLLTFTAAFIEGFIAPLSIPIQFKIAIGVVCAVFLLLYLIIPSFKAGAEIELR